MTKPPAQAEHLLAIEGLILSAHHPGVPSQTEGNEKE
jgi:hypothetical protein